MRSQNILIAAFALVTLASCSKKENAAEVAKARADSMKLAYRSFAAAWDVGKAEEFDKYLSADLKVHEDPLPGMKPGLAGIKEMSTVMKTGFPDMKTTIVDVGVDSNILVVSYTDTCTNTGMVMGKPPTNQQITGNGSYKMRWENGKFVEMWRFLDGPKMLVDFGKP